MFGYDCCFCDNRDCPRTDCRRHSSWMPVGVPVSVADLGDGSEDCEYYMED